MRDDARSTAYWLVQAMPGAAGRIRGEASRLPGVTHADLVHGPYDVIVRSEATRGLTETMRALSGIDGVLRVLPCRSFGIAQLDADEAVSLDARVGQHA